MFWLNKHKTDKRKAGKTDPQKKNSKAGSGNKKETSVGYREGQCQSREEIHAEALANARQARENLGDETIQKINEAMAKMNSSPLAIAKQQIQKSDADRVASEILGMLDERD
jgi:hypothetical protein